MQIDSHPSHKKQASQLIHTEQHYRMDQIWYKITTTPQEIYLKEQFSDKEMYSIEVQHQMYNTSDEDPKYRFVSLGNNVIDLRFKEMFDKTKPLD